MWSKYIRSTLLAPFKSIIVFLTIVTALHIRCPELTSIHLKKGSLYPWTTAHLVSISPPRPWKPLCYPLFVSSSFWVSTRKWDDTVFVVFKQLSVEWWKSNKPTDLHWATETFGTVLGTRPPGPGYKLWLRLQRASKKKKEKEIVLSLFLTLGSLSQRGFTYKYKRRKLLVIL